MKKLQLKYFLQLSILGLSIFITACSPNLPNNLFSNNQFDLIYSEKKEKDWVIPPTPYKKIPSEFLRKKVINHTKEKPGTIVIDTNNHFLYYIENEQTAIRYGIGVGKAGFTWSGKGYVGMKKQWPTWTPTAAMVKRDPYLNGIMKTYPPGLNNPLGPRAIYIYNEKGDTLYRIHGSPEWWSIGKNVSSGCIRLLNQDIIDLYDRVKKGAKIIVY
ncbi:L,D-transpeptidase [Bartonella sp. DGB1]|uniref:L,D-transpeptidase n=1 Tax=Bartonella sp. DGB1 TaxID=3239807 RepID=UPI003524F208